MRCVLGYGQHVKPKVGSLLRYRVINFYAVLRLLRSLARLDGIAVVGERYADITVGHRFDVARGVDVAYVGPNLAQYRFDFDEILRSRCIGISPQVLEYHSHPSDRIVHDVNPTPR